MFKTFFSQTIQEIAEQTEKQIDEARLGLLAHQASGASPPGPFGWRGRPERFERVWGVWGWGKEVGRDG